MSTLVFVVLIFFAPKKMFTEFYYQRTARSEDPNSKARLDRNSYQSKKIKSEKKVLVINCNANLP